ncbi:RNA-binding S4 domain-containing protein [Sphingomonas aliaeris]|uniref:RNA-binding S4 domain-containing protein n=1 Tax=Sphingomonas aliaeris TaxID=2759526 RepID=A0A974NUB1_9SPHN|nr:S4 domain-containing protein [Sphingomonas aliaeris]QQV77045.1 RNA-binding S4 domain-containing protein [Sphingomonas aliaeris]
MADAGGAGGGISMRLDRFLWFVRLAKTRSAAQALAAHSRLRLDGRPIDRAHAQVRIGNVLTLLYNDRVRVIRVAALPARRGPAPEARACYDELTAAAGEAGHENVSQQAASD